MSFDKASFLAALDVVTANLPKIVSTSELARPNPTMAPEKMTALEVGTRVVLPPETRQLLLEDVAFRESVVTTIEKNNCQMYDDGSHAVIVPIKAK